MLCEGETAGQKYLDHMPLKICKKIKMLRYRQSHTHTHTHQNDCFTWPLKWSIINVCLECK